MELFAQDYFMIEGGGKITEDFLESLFLLYQPFIGHESCSLFITLNTLNNDSESKKHIELCNLLDISIEKLEKARIRLEQYGLIKAYLKEGKRNQYIYSLKPVLKPLEFLNHFAFGLQYNERFGLQKYQEMKSFYEKRFLDKSEYKDISEHLERQNILNLSIDQLKDMIQSNKKETQLPSAFDYDRFLKGLSNIVFPKKLRTDENLQLIGQLAVVYGISEERMRTLVSRSIDIEKCTFSKDGLIKKVRAEKPTYELEKISGYQLPPILFLQEKQFGTPISNTDKRLLESLVNDYDLSPVVVNILIEYVLEENNKILSADYVRKIAATWVMHEVKTEEDAHRIIAMLSRNSKEKEMRSATVTEKKVVKTKKKVDQGTPVVDDQDIEELEKLMQKLGERYEKS